MRFISLAGISLVGAIIAAPAAASAQVRVQVDIGGRRGPEIGVVAYSPRRVGEWRDNYQRWTPVTLYYYEPARRYYARPVHGARPVMLYSYRGEYFLPPRHESWDRVDRRFAERKDDRFANGHDNRRDDRWDGRSDSRDRGRERNNGRR